MENFKYYIIVFIAILSGLFNSVYSQNFSYKRRPSNKMEVSYANMQTTKLNNFKKAKDLTELLPKGFSTKGNVDYTSYLQEGINQYDKVIMPNFTVLINDKGLKLRNNNHLLFQKNSVLVLKPTSKSQYSLLMIDGVQNVAVHYPKIIGDRKNHLGSKGQWGMGIWIKNSKNIQIFSPNISNCWGDGIYLGHEKGSAVNENVKIVNGIIDNNRRNGISIISGRNIEINNVFISNTNGQNPQSGIDIEPNSNDDILEDIRLLNIETFNNTMNGIVVSIGNLSGQKKKVVSIEIDNHKDTYSYLGLSFLMSRHNSKGTMSNVAGTINLKNLTYNDPGLASLMTYKGKKNNKVNINIENVNVLKRNRRVNFNKDVFKENLNNGIQYKVQ